MKTIKESTYTGKNRQDSLDRLMCFLDPSDTNSAITVTFEDEQTKFKMVEDLMGVYSLESARVLTDRKDEMILLSPSITKCASLLANMPEHLHPYIETFNNYLCITNAEGLTTERGTLPELSDGFTHTLLIDSAEELTKEQLAVFSLVLDVKFVYLHLNRPGACYNVPSDYSGFDNDFNDIEGNTSFIVNFVDNDNKTLPGTTITTLEPGKTYVPETGFTMGVTVKHTGKSGFTDYSNLHILKGDIIHYRDWLFRVVETNTVNAKLLSIGHPSDLPAKPMIVKLSDLRDSNLSLPLNYVAPGSWDTLVVNVAGLGDKSKENVINHLSAFTSNLVVTNV